MSTINASSLFHFTDFEGLKGILNKGFRLSYCLEHYPKRLKIAIPMICFCDIPLMRVNKHKKYYGNYAIGIDKDKFCKRYSFELNPILYRNSISLDIAVNESIKRLTAYRKKSLEMVWGTIEEDFSERILGKEPHAELINYEDSLSYCVSERIKEEMLLAYVKPYSYGKRIFYDEREWRITADSFEKGKEWLWKIKVKDFNAIRGEKNKSLWESGNVYYKVNALEDITHIIVQNEDEKKEIINYISNMDEIMGHELSDDEKSFLLTKITSFERIKKDY